MDGWRLPEDHEDVLSAELGMSGSPGHAEGMSEPTEYAVTLDDLVASVHVPLEEQVEEQDDRRRPEHDESVGHLPGNVRPYAL